MNIKGLILTFFFIGFYFSPIISSEESVFEEKTKAVYKKLVECKNSTTNFIKNHPFISIFILAALVNKDFRQFLKKIPKNFWWGIQKHPVATALCVGFFLSSTLN